MVLSFTVSAAKTMAFITVGLISIKILHIFFTFNDLSDENNHFTYTAIVDYTYVY